MSVSIIVPFRSDGAERDRNWNYLRARYEALFPDWEIVEGTCEGRWSKGMAVNTAVEASSGDVLVVSDADVLISEQALTEAVKALEYSPWVVPHRMLFRLNEEATQALLEDRLRTDPHWLTEDEIVHPPRRGPAGGGISVMNRDAFAAVNGIDERFLDWGGEDISFARALDTLIGQHRCLAQVMWHLYHEPMPRREDNRASLESEALAARYLEASGNRLAMHELVTQRPYEAMVGGGIVVGRREVLQDVPLDVRFQVWGQEDESWGIALRRLAGEPWRGEADLVHLHHPPVPIDRRDRWTQVRGSISNWDLRVRYFKAQHDSELMRSLVEEGRMMTR